MTAAAPPERFAPLDAAAMSPAQRDVAAAIAGGPRGGIAGPFKALLHSPELADKVQQLGAHIRFRSALPRRLNELAILVTGRKWRAEFEVWAHRRFALEAGLDPAIADAIAAGQRPEAMDAAEAAVHDFAHQLVHDGRVDDAAFAAVSDLFGQAGAVELVGTCGYYSLVSFVLNVDRVPLPDGAAPPFPEG